MDLVQRRVRGSQHLTTGVPEGEPAGQSGVVAIEQSTSWLDEKSTTRALASTKSSNVLTTKTWVPTISHTGA